MAVSAATRPHSELSYPGVYRSVCVTLRLHHLAVAAVEVADALAELEGAASGAAAAVSGSGGGGGSGPGCSNGAAGFKVLRALQAAWIRDATANRNMWVIRGSGQRRWKNRSHSGCGTFGTVSFGITSPAYTTAHLCRPTATSLPPAVSFPRCQVLPLALHFNAFPSPAPLPSNTFYCLMRV